jgi:hypothetical protein
MQRHGSETARRAAAVLCSVVALIILATFLGPAPALALVPLPDYNEPNESYGDATRLKNGQMAYGALVDETDMDYFYMDIPGPDARHVDVTFHSHIIGRNAELAFLGPGMREPQSVRWVKDFDDDGSYVADGVIGPGRLFIVVSLVGGAAPSTVQYDLTVHFEGPSGFTDVPATHPYYAPITYLANEGVVSGFVNGSFGPEELVKRQQFAKMIVGAVHGYVQEYMSCPFDDLGPDDPYDRYPHEYVAVAAASGITVGTSATHYSPTKNITLAQVVTMVMRAGEQEDKYAIAPSTYAAPFADFGAPHYYWARMGAYNHIFDDYQGPYNWWEPATRAQCAFFLWKMMEAPAAG